MTVSCFRDPFLDTSPPFHQISLFNDHPIHIYVYNTRTYTHIYIHMYISVRLATRSPVDGRSAYGIKRISRGCWKGCWEAFIMVLRRKLSGLAFPKGVFLMQEFQKLEEFR